MLDFCLVWIFNQLTVIDEYTRHKYMELAIVATVNWLNYTEWST